MWLHTVTTNVDNKLIDTKERAKVPKEKFYFFLIKLYFCLCRVINNISVGLGLLRPHVCCVVVKSCCSVCRTSGLCCMEVLRDVVEPPPQDDWESPQTFNSLVEAGWLLDMAHSYNALLYTVTLREEKVCSRSFISVCVWGAEVEDHQKPGCAADKGRREQVSSLLKLTQLRVGSDRK